MKHTHIYTWPWTSPPASTSSLCLVSFWTGFAHTLEAQNTVIKAAGEEDLRYMLLKPLPLAFECHDRHKMAGVIRELEALLPDIKRIIKI